MATSPLGSNFPEIKNRPLVFCSTSHESYIPRVEEAIRGLNIGVLVNNVGMSYDHPEPFLNASSEMVNAL
jgi:hypothetical protein